MLKQNEKPDIILLDDAFQHRKVKAGFYILLTAYDDLFCDDYLLPTGNLRESSNGAKRANVIIVTKCPANITELEQEKLKEKLMRFFLHQNDKLEEIFFSRVSYDDKIYSSNDSLDVSKVKLIQKMLLAGIAKPKPFFDYLQADSDEIMTYSDHHHFKESDILTIKSRAIDKIIITTEKDFVRLDAKILANQLYYLPIKSNFVTNQATFDQTILNYVGTCTRNRYLY